jgi:hypothetical protein
MSIKKAAEDICKSIQDHGQDPQLWFFGHAQISTKAICFSPHFLVV